MLLFLASVYTFHETFGRKSKNYRGRGSVDLECQSQKAVLMEGGNKSSSTSSLDHGDLESQTQRTGNKSSSTSHKNKWRMFLIIHRASQIIVSSSKADKANPPKASHENVGCAEDITGVSCFKYITYYIS